MVVAVSCCGDYSAEARKVVTVGPKLDKAKYRIIRENLKEVVKDLNTGAGIPPYRQTYSTARTICSLKHNNVFAAIYRTFF